MSWVTLASEGCGYLVVMEISSRKQHWEHVYATKSPTEVSWFQSVPATSLALLQEEGVGPGAHVMDVGGGDSVLVDLPLHPCRQTPRLRVLLLSADCVMMINAGALCPGR